MAYGPNGSQKTANYCHPLRPHTEKAMLPLSRLVSAVREGRGDFDNVRKILLTILAANEGEILRIPFAPLIGSIHQPSSSVIIISHHQSSSSDISSDYFVGLARGRSLE